MLRLSRLRLYSTLLPIAAVHRPRNVSTSSFDPTIRQFLVKLAEQQPCFSMRSSSVSILHEPRLFYQTLLVRAVVFMTIVIDRILRILEYDTKCTT